MAHVQMGEALRRSDVKFTWWLLHSACLTLVQIRYRAAGQYGSRNLHVQAALLLKSSTPHASWHHSFHGQPGPSWGAWDQDCCRRCYCEVSYLQGLTGAGLTCCAARLSTGGGRRLTDWLMVFWC